jgi:hypothetical protein
LRENLGFKVGVAECFLEFEIEFGLQSGRAEWVSEFERESSGFKGRVAERVSEFERESSGFKGRVAERVSEFQREIGFQRESCRVVFGI